MLNLFQHLIQSIGYATLNQVQGDTKGSGGHSYCHGDRGMKQYFVYILKCNDGSYYTGVTITWREDFLSIKMDCLVVATRTKKDLYSLFL